MTMVAEVARSSLRITRKRTSMTEFELTNTMGVASEVIPDTKIGVSIFDEINISTPESVKANANDMMIRDPHTAFNNNRPVPISITKDGMIHITGGEGLESNTTF